MKVTKGCANKSYWTRQRKNGYKAAVLEREINDQLLKDWFDKKNKRRR